MSRFLLPRLGALAPYTPGEQPQNGKYIKLNTNECPYPPSAKAVEAANGEAARLNLYSDPTAAAVGQALANTFGVGPQNIFAGNGSDEILAFCFFGLCPTGAAFADITYGFYPVWAGLYGLPVQVVPLRPGFALAPEDYFGLGKTIFIANPNAPTGLALTRAQVESILRANPGSLVVVDEAYVDFGAESCVSLVPKYDNLMVVGTFSKSRALAGGRFGYAVACQALVEDLNRIKFSFNPYNVNRVTLAAAKAALEDVEYFESCRANIMQTRAWLQTRLAALGFESTQSLANFVFARHPGFLGQRLYEALKEQGILVRWFDKPAIQNYLRITIGTKAEAEALAAALARLVGA